MRTSIIAALVAVSGFAGIANAKPEFKRYAPTAQTFRVEGKDVGAAEAVLAYSNGKHVELCKGLSAAQSKGKIIVAGKEMDASKLQVCKPVVGKETKTGLGLAVAK